MLRMEEICKERFRQYCNITKLDTLDLFSFFDDKLYMYIVFFGLGMCFVVQSFVFYAWFRETKKYALKNRFQQFL